MSWDQAEIERRQNLFNMNTQEFLKKHQLLKTCSNIDVWEVKKQNKSILDLCGIQFSGANKHCFFVSWVIASTRGLSLEFKKDQLAMPQLI
jgi:uncharacterized protein YhbP (UPF0306 family)